jgi:hypothetical protein
VTTRETQIREEPTRRADPAGNERLTAMTGAVLLVLFVAECLTLLNIGNLLTLHVFLGMLLLGPVGLKIGSTLWRFTRYYTGSAGHCPASVCLLCGWCRWWPEADAGAGAGPHAPVVVGAGAVCRAARRCSRGCTGFCGSGSAVITGSCTQSTMTGWWSWSWTSATAARSTVPTGRVAIRFWRRRRVGGMWPQSVLGG